MLDSGISSGFAARVNHLYETGKNFLFILKDQNGNSFTVRRIDGIIRYGAVSVKEEMKIEGVLSASVEDFQEMLKRAEALFANW